MAYEKLMMEYHFIKIEELQIMPRKLLGLYFDNEILIDKYIGKHEKHCVLAEEIGHYETTTGDITDQTILRNRQLENIARRWAYKRIVSLDKIIECYLKGHTTLYDMCNHLEITPKFLKTSIDHYIAKFGGSKTHGEYVVLFEPLNVRKVVHENALFF
jgi:hypothetical protein